MMSVCSILLAVAVFSELNRLSVIMAVPSAKVEDGAPEQEVMDQILGDETLTEPAVGPSMYRRSLMLDNSMKDDGIPKVIIIPRGHGVRELNSAFTRSVPRLSERGLSHPPGELPLKIDQRDKDLDMLRCMIGRVYRPCW